MGKPSSNAEFTSLYRMYDSAGSLLYVGITSSVPRRMRQHSGDKPWWALVARTDVEHFALRSDALAAEARAISRENPKWNVSRPMIRNSLNLPVRCELNTVDWPLDELATIFLGRDIGSVLMHLVALADDTGEVVCSLSDLSRQTRLTRVEVGRCLDAARAAGWLVHVALDRVKVITPPVENLGEPDPAIVESFREMKRLCPYPGDMPAAPLWVAVV